MRDNFRVRIWRICHLKSHATCGPLMFTLRQLPSQQRRTGMIHKLTKCLTAGALVVTLAIAPPALAFHGGGGGFGGGMHGDGFGGGMHGGGFGGETHAMGGGGMHFGGMGGGPRFFALSSSDFDPGCVKTQKS